MSLRAAQNGRTLPNKEQTKYIKDRKLGMKHKRNWYMRQESLIGWISQQKDDSLPKPYSLQINVEKFSYKPIAVQSPPQMVLLQLI